MRHRLHLAGCGCERNDTSQPVSSAFRLAGALPDAGLSATVGHCRVRTGFAQVLFDPRSGNGFLCGVCCICLFL